MKKKIVAVCAAVGLALALPTMAFALPWHGGNVNQTQAAQRSFVDENADGVCDNAGTGAGAGYVDENADGVCDNAGTGAGAGYGASVCDGSGQGQSNGQGHHGGRTA